MFSRPLEGAEKLEQVALAVARDDPSVSEPRVFNLGGGCATSGLLIAGQREDRGETILLVLLLD